MEQILRLPGEGNAEREPLQPRKIPRSRNESDHSPSDLSAQETLLGLIATGQIPKDMVSKKDFDDEELKSIYSGLISGLSPAALVDTAPDDDSRSRYVRVLLSPHAENTDQLIAMAQQCLNRIRRVSLQKQYDDLMKKISLLPSDSPEVTSCLLQAQEVQSKLKAL